MSSIQTAAPARRALIIHAHPEPNSFSTAQANAFADQMRSENVEVDFVDLYAEQWDPVLAREQFMDGPGYFKPQAEQMRALSEGSLPQPVKESLHKVQHADLLVLSFPLWWFSVPAIMKGWVDQVFVINAIFGGEYGIFAEGGMTGKKAMLLVTTGGAEAAYTPNNPDGYGDIDKFLFHIHRGMLEFVGYDVIPPFVTHEPVRLGDEARASALADARAYVTNKVLG